MKTLRNYYRGRDGIWWFSHAVMWIIGVIVVGFAVNLVWPL